MDHVCAGAAGGPPVYVRIRMPYSFISCLFSLSKIARYMHALASIKPDCTRDAIIALAFNGDRPHEILSRARYITYYVFVAVLGLRSVLP